MTSITRREAVRVILRSTGGLVVAGTMPGCVVQSGSGNANGTGAGDSDTDPDRAALLAIAADDHVEGDPDAPNVIIEYGDFQCSVCGSFFRENAPAVKTELVETGRAVLVFRHFPLSSIHEHARLAAIASECAVDFFEYHDLLFNNQDALTRADLIAYAGQVGLNTTTFESCLDGGAKTPRVDRDINSGNRLGVTGTPTFFVNGAELVGNRPVDDFAALLV